MGLRTRQSGQYVQAYGCSEGCPARTLSTTSLDPAHEMSELSEQRSPVKRRPSKTKEILSSAPECSFVRLEGRVGSPKALLALQGIRVQCSLCRYVTRTLSPACGVHAFHWIGCCGYR